MRGKRGRATRKVVICAPALPRACLGLPGSGHHSELSPHTQHIAPHSSEAVGTSIMASEQILEEQAALPKALAASWPEGLPDPSKHQPSSELSPPRVKTREGP